MTGMIALLAKEWMEIRRTWRIWVMPGLLLFTGAVAPVMAKIAPALVESLATSQPGTIIQLPEPIAQDAFFQFTESLNQMVLIALIIACADLISGERRSGTALLILTKPVSRAAFVMSKVIAQILSVLAPLVAASLACWIGTRLIFGAVSMRPLIEASALWFALAISFIAVMTLLSTLFSAQAGAAGIGIAVYAGMILLGQWEWTRRLSPGGIFSALDRAIRNEPLAVTGPLIATGVFTVACLAIAIWRFQRTEFTGGA
jgi:ABC-2 type transport system permease protein